MKKLMFAVFVSLLICTGCANIAQVTTNAPDIAGLSLPERLQGPRVGAHQGNIYSFKGNTLAAFERARREGADIIELDLRNTKDGIPVVYHDRKLGLWTKCRKQVSELKLSELPQCHFRFNKEHIPTFEEALLWSQGRVILDAELKEAGPIAPAVALVKKYGAYEWVYFEVKDREEYEIIRRMDSRIAVLLSPRTQTELERILALKDDRILVIDLYEQMRTKENIALIHASGKFSSKNAWHLDGIQELFGASCLDVFRLGIDIAISNRAVGCVEQKQIYLREKSKKAEGE